MPRSTHDIDFVIEYDETQVSKILESFQGDFFIQEISVESGYVFQSGLVDVHEFDDEVNVRVRRNGAWGTAFAVAEL